MLTADFSCFLVTFALPRTVWQLEEAARDLGTRQFAFVTIRHLGFDHAEPRPGAVFTR